MLANIDASFNPDEITFDLFCKLVAIYIELANSPAMPQADDIKEEESTRKYEQEDQEEQEYEEEQEEEQEELGESQDYE